MTTARESQQRTYRLVEIQAKIKHALNGGPFGSKLGRKDYVESGVPVIRGQNLSGKSLFDESEFVFVSEEKADDLSPNTARRGDVVFTQRGTLGQVGLIPVDSKFDRYVISQSQMKLTVDQDTADPRYVYYYFRSPETVMRILNHATQSGVPHINLDVLRNFEIDLPPLATQREIAGILSAYDDLIENNTRRIQILEEMARAIYREWFVHFRYPGHENDRLVESELGLVPEGWEVKRLGDVVEIQRQNISASALDGAVFAHFSFPAFDANEMPFLEDGTDIRSGKLRVPESSVLLSKLNPRIPRVWWPEWDHEYDAIASTEFLCLVPGTQLSRSYLYSLCKSEGFQAKFERLALGTSTSHQRVKQRDLETLLIAVPHHSVLDRFDLLSLPLYQHIVELRRQNLVLDRIRDWVLPRLISGGIIDSSL